MMLRSLLFSIVLVVAALVLSLFVPSSIQASTSNWNTFLKGNSVEAGQGIAVDEWGNVFVTGRTYSLDFPTTSGVLDSVHGGESDIFVVKFDPSGSTLEYSTLLGGEKEDTGHDIALDDFGSTYIVGTTNSGDIPITSGAFDTSYNGFNDVYVAKLNQMGNILEYATFLGGTSLDFGYDIDVSNFGDAYVTGETWSEDFPTTLGAFDITHDNFDDAFVVRLDSMGSSIIYSTFLGGCAGDNGRGISVNNFGEAFIVGYTDSETFPTTPGSFDPSYNGPFPPPMGGDAFVTKLSSSGENLIYSTFVGGSLWDWGHDIAIDGNGSAYVTGRTSSNDFPTSDSAFNRTHGGSSDAFITKLNAEGNELEYSTLLGGTGWEYAYDIEVDNSGHAFITGIVQSPDFPISPGAFDTSNSGLYDTDLFITKLNQTGSELEYSTFLGGSHSETGNNIAVDTEGNAYVTGSTGSVDFQVTDGAFDTTYHGNADVFVAKINFDGSDLIFATFLAGDSSSVDPDTLVPVISEQQPVSLPEVCHLQQNYPNPFNLSTEIAYQVHKDAHIELIVFNPLGQKIKTLADFHHKRGKYSAQWDGRDTYGHEVASGLYFCRLKVGGFCKTIKMALVK
jgi:hypothetical protein